MKYHNNSIWKILKMFKYASRKLFTKEHKIKNTINNR